MNTNTRLVRPLRNGQITLPAAFRHALDLDQAPMLQITLQDGELRIRPYHPDRLETGSTWLADLYRLYRPVRQKISASNALDLDIVIDTLVARLQGGHHAPRRP